MISKKGACPFHVSYTIHIINVFQSVNTTLQIEFIKEVSLPEISRLNLIMNLLSSLILLSAMTLIDKFCS